MRDRAYALTLLHGPRDWLALMRTAPFAALVPALMRLSLPRLAALVDRPPSSRCPPSAEIERLDRVMTLAPRIGRPLVRSGCLTRGLTLYWFLRRAGLDVELRFGLDPEVGGELTDGHCWLTLDGEPYLEPRDPRPRFTELYRLPLASAACVR
ncbi:MAG TPA: lasso peptide biosynthesis B2 protein [Solirubrobacteraceae bacterium]